MSSLGFAKRQITVIMTCVTSTSHSVLINGQPSTAFQPCRGLYQGDHLSLYLYLIFVKIFSTLLYDFGNSKAITLSHICSLTIIVKIFVVIRQLSGNISSNYCLPMKTTLDSVSIYKTPPSSIAQTLTELFGLNCQRCLVSPNAVIKSILAYLPQSSVQNSPPPALLKIKYGQGLTIGNICFYPKSRRKSCLYMLFKPYLLTA